jgi:hypothetical protein
MVELETRLSKLIQAISSHYDKFYYYPNIYGTSGASHPGFPSKILYAFVQTQIRLKRKPRTLNNVEHSTADICRCFSKFKGTGKEVGEIREEVKVVKILKELYNPLNLKGFFTCLSLSMGQPTCH